MARAKKMKVTEETLAVEETPVVEESTPEVYKVVLHGTGPIHGSVNGETFSLPAGMELEVPAHIYHAVKAHIKEER